VPPLGSSSASPLVAIFEVFGHVAGPAEQLAVVDVGVSAVSPVVGMVDVAVAGFGTASWSLTVPVPGDDGPPLRGGPHSGFAADVEDF
jgi:hypothetical protein